MKRLVSILAAVIVFVGLCYYFDVKLNFWFYVNSDDYQVNWNSGDSQARQTRNDAHGKIKRHDGAPTFNNDDVYRANEKSNTGVTYNPRLKAAYDNKITKLQLKGQGIIVKVLKDDLKGSRHQRIVLKVNQGQTVLVVHNIDIATRIPQLKEGEVLKFYGEYVWNNKGGLIHWTHRAPRGRHEHGWLIYQGKTYQ